MATEKGQTDPPEDDDDLFFDDLPTLADFHILEGHKITELMISDLAKAVFPEIMAKKQSIFDLARPYKELQNYWQEQKRRDRPKLTDQLDLFEIVEEGHAPKWRPHRFAPPKLLGRPEAQEGTGVRYFAVREKQLAGGILRLYEDHSELWEAAERQRGSEALAGRLVDGLLRYGQPGFDACLIPKAGISGDFMIARSLTEDPSRFLWLVGDCTGHGVETAIIKAYLILAIDHLIQWEITAGNKFRKNSPKLQKFPYGDFWSPSGLMSAPPNEEGGEGQRLEILRTEQPEKLLIYLKDRLEKGFTVDPKEHETQSPPQQDRGDTVDATDPDGSLVADIPRGFVGLAALIKGKKNKDIQIEFASQDMPLWALTFTKKNTTLKCIFKGLPEKSTSDIVTTDAVLSKNHTLYLSLSDGVTDALRISQADGDWLPEGEDLREWILSAAKTGWKHWHKTGCAQGQTQDKYLAARPHRKTLGYAVRRVFKDRLEALERAFERGLPDDMMVSVLDVNAIIGARK